MKRKRYWVLGISLLCFSVSLPQGLRPIKIYADFSRRWSPDGKKIVFCSNRLSSHRADFVMDVDGSNLHQLTKTDSGSGDYYPEFMPDGSKIAFFQAVMAIAICIL